jgi:flagellar biosynthetic protein FlhB
MAESDSGEKTEDPTAKKLADARKKGQIARSKDLGTLFVLGGSAVAMMLVGSVLVDRLSVMMISLLSLTRDETRDVNSLFGVVSDAINGMIAPIMWIFVIIILAAFIGNTVLGGISWSWEAMAPKASKLSPIAGFKRMFGVKAYVELVKSLMKFFVVFFVAFGLLSSLFEQILSLSIEAIPFNFSHAVNLLLWMFFALAMSLILIVIVDAPYQKWDHNKQLKMTKQEVKDEMKNTIPLIICVVLNQ